MSEIRKEEQELVEQLAKALWDSESKEGDAEWPKDSRRQPYCQSTYREAEFLLPLIRSHTNALIGAAIEACAGKIENFKFLCEENERAYASAKRIFAQAIRDFTREATRDELERIKAEARLEGIEEYKRSLNVPELEDFAKGVIVEAQHQRQRWGNKHDIEKEPEEWFWVVGYLAGKGLRAQRDGDTEKFKHHLITGAAIMANWHAREKERIAELTAAAKETR